MNVDVMDNTPTENCRMAIPKKGRLHEKVVAVLSGSGIEFYREPRLDVALCKDLPITLVFLPASDIAKYVGEGNIDIGVTGIDIVEETAVTVDRVLDLGFGKCRLCLQAMKHDRVEDAAELAGKRIVTSFPALTQKFFEPLDEQKGVKTRVKFVSGSVEAACGLGLGDAVVDLVETGTTMRAAGLEIVTEILQTQAILIANPHSQHRDIAELIKRRIEGYITATKYLMISYNIHVNLLDKAVAITPGKRSPTITGLEDEDFKAVSSLVLKKEANKKMDELHDIGATDILVFELANSRM